MLLQCRPLMGTNYDRRMKPEAMVESYISHNVKFPCLSSSRGPPVVEGLYG